MKMVIFLLLLISFLPAKNVHDWQTFTNSNQVFDLAVKNGEIWGATDGGVLRYEIQSQALSRYTNIDGMFSVSKQAIVADEHAQIITGGRDGILEVYSINSDSWQAEFILQDNPITDIIYINDTLWVAAGKGVAVFVWAGDQYRFVDYFINFPALIGHVNKLELYDSRIWMATDKGVLTAPADLSRFTINDPAQWRLIDKSSGLSVNEVDALERHNGKLYIGTSKGLFYTTKDFQVKAEANWAKDESGEYRPIQNFYSTGSELYVASYSVIYEFTSDTTRVKFSGPAPVNELYVDHDQNFWLATSGKGIYQWPDKNIILKDGPYSNVDLSVLKAADGKIYACSGRPKLYSTNGLFIKEDKWLNYIFIGVGWEKINNAVYFYQDRFENVWFGSWGGGLGVFRSNGEMEFFHNYTDPGRLYIRTPQSGEAISMDDYTVYQGYFTGIVGTPTYEVISAIKEDKRGKLWVANPWATDDRLLKVIPYKDNGFVDLDINHWEFFGSSDGIGGSKGDISALAFDDWGHVWIGTFSNGLYELDYNQTLSDHSDDVVTHYTISDNLYSNTIYALEVDRDGIVWIGTGAGLNSYDGIRIYKHVGDPEGLNGPLENRINNIVVDDFNNRWFATSGGLSILRAGRSPWENNAWIGFNTENSGLVDNQVFGLFVDNRTSQALIGTMQGISLYTGSFAQVQENYNQIAAGPNPFLIQDNQDKFMITHLMQNSTVKIFTLNGVLIRELKPGKSLSDGTPQVDGSRAYWDGRDRFGHLVPSGIYVYFAYTVEKSSSAGKIAVIRK